MYTEMIGMLYDGYRFVRFVLILSIPGLICGVLYQFPFRGRNTSLWLFFPAAFVCGWATYGVKLSAAPPPGHVWCGTCLMTGFITWQFFFPIPMAVGACCYREIAKKIVSRRLSGKGSEEAPTDGNIVSRPCGSP